MNRPSLGYLWSIVRQTALFCILATILSVPAYSASLIEARLKAAKDPSKQIEILKPLVNTIDQVNPQYFTDIVHFLGTQLTDPIWLTTEMQQRPAFLQLLKTISTQFPTEVEEAVIRPGLKSSSAAVQAYTLWLAYDLELKSDEIRAKARTLSNDFEAHIATPAALIASLNGDISGDRPIELLKVLSHGLDTPAELSLQTLLRLGLHKTAYRNELAKQFMLQTIFRNRGGDLSRAPHIVSAITELANNPHFLEKYLVKNPPDKEYFALSIEPALKNLFQQNRGIDQVILTARRLEYRNPIIHKCIAEYLINPTTDAATALAAKETILELKPSDETTLKILDQALQDQTFQATAKLYWPKLLEMRIPQIYPKLDQDKAGKILLDNLNNPKIVMGALLQLSDKKMQLTPDLKQALVAILKEFLDHRQNIDQARLVIKLISTSEFQDDTIDYNLARIARTDTSVNHHFSEIRYAAFSYVFSKRKSLNEVILRELAVFDPEDPQVLMRVSFIAGMKPIDHDIQRAILQYTDYIVASKSPSEIKSVLERIDALNVTGAQNIRILSSIFERTETLRRENNLQLQIFTQANLTITASAAAKPEAVEEYLQWHGNNPERADEVLKHLDQMKSSKHKLLLKTPLTKAVQKILSVRTNPLHLKLSLNEKNRILRALDTIIEFHLYDAQTLKFVKRWSSMIKLPVVNVLLDNQGNEFNLTEKILRKAKDVLAAAEERAPQNNCSQLLQIKRDKK